jgi:DNA-binding HxlR family transcriptional regulator
MDKQEQLQFESMKAEIANLKRLVILMSNQLKNLERDNARIKHEARTIRAQVSYIDSRSRGG